ncbi:UPF0182 family protein [candidate division KSB1 bacterium]|nr:UPF0182 family protein [candidate division KSB1 bacterium]
MYTALLIILLGIAAVLFVSGITNRRIGRIVSGGIIAVVTLCFFWFMGFWGDVLWFQSVGHAQRFWIEIGAKIVFMALGAFVGWLVVFMLTFAVPKQKKFIRCTARAAGFLLGAAMSASNWGLILRYLNRVSTQLKDPIFGRDVSFYLFTLPFYDMLYKLLLLLAVVAFVAALSAIYLRIRNQAIQFDISQIEETTSSRATSAVYISAAVLLFMLAFGKYLARFHLMFSHWGAVTGPGWTDVHVRLPAYLLTVIITVALGIFLLIPSLRNLLKRVVSRRVRSQQAGQPAVLLGTAIVMFLGWFILLTVIPGLLQWLSVEPNEITYEKPYISNNIKFTRHAFNLDRVEKREFPVSAQFTPEMVDQNQNLFSNIRLWDYRALVAVYKQFQEIRLYYEFSDVDIDRYMINNAYRQVMVSARELELANLPAQSQTFVNQRFKYTHGFGLTLTTVSEFTPQGLPNLLIKDIPPKSAYPSLNVKRPEIYYGELTNTHVIVNSKEQEFDYPSGEDNIYVRYSGAGGVQISNLWRKFLFGWKFDGTRLLLSGYPTANSRIMFHRQIKERIKTLAPFLTFDDDPYIVLVNGKLYWIIDAYTTSDYYPYSEPFSSKEYIEYKEGNRTRMLTSDVASNLDGVNYIRNSVKVVVDAFNGNVDFYVFDNRDPIIQVWEKIFPTLFKQKADMPADLMAHVRYPADMLLAQGLMYAKYHMTDPTVFYNQEDLWIRATEKYYSHVQPVEPYYIMWELPGSKKPEYSLILPFTPKNRQVMIGWIAGMCDGDNYGRFLAYNFPKEKRILGPQQVETKIDQDSFLSGQLSLWDQHGSNVIRGNVLAIPIDETLLYVEPIYLQAEIAAYPELRLVAVMHDDNLSYAATFDQALKGIFEDHTQTGSLENDIGALDISTSDLIRKANNAFEDYLRLLGDKKFQEASNALQTLQETLQKLVETENKE